MLSRAALYGGSWSVFIPDFRSRMKLEPVDQAAQAEGARHSVIRASWLITVSSWIPEPPAPALETTYPAYTVGESTSTRASGSVCADVIDDLVRPTILRINSSASPKPYTRSLPLSPVHKAYDPASIGTNSITTPSLKYTSARSPARERAGDVNLKKLDH